MIIYVYLTVYLLGKDTCWISWISQLLAMANTQWTGDGCSIPCCTFRLSAVGARIKSGRRHSQDLKYTNQHSPATLRCDQDLWELASSLQSVNRNSRPVGNCWSKLRSRTRQWIHHPANMLRMKRSQLEPPVSLSFTAKACSGNASFAAFSTHDGYFQVTAEPVSTCLHGTSWHQHAPTMPSWTWCIWAIFKNILKSDPVDKFVQICIFPDREFLQTTSKCSRLKSFGVRHCQYSQAVKGVSWVQEILDLSPSHTPRFVTWHCAGSDLTS